MPKWPRWTMPLYLFLASLPCDALSAFLAFSDRVVYRAYATSPRALEDQASAGALMWFCVTIAYAVPAAVIVVNMLSPRHVEV
jgi:cytochrome c oxidase assembly factor CtaG